MKNFKTKISILTLILLFSTTFLFAQAEKGLKLIDKNKFPAAEIAIKKDLNSSKYGAMAEYAMAKLYATVGYSAYHLDTAYAYILKAEKTFKKMDYKLKSKIRKKFNTSQIKKQKKAIATKAFLQAEETETLETWNHFINFYKKPGRKHEKKAAIYRNDIAFKKAEENNTWEEYATLLKAYGASFKKRSPGLFKKAERQLINTYIEEKSWSAYDQFIEKFPNNSYAKKNVIEELDSLLSLKKPALIFDFTKRYKNTVFAQKGVDSLAQELPKYGSPSDCKKFLAEHKEYSNTDAIWKRWYSIVKQKASSWEALANFLERHPDYPDKAQIDTDVALYKQNREKAHFQNLTSTSSIQNYYNFLDKYPGSTHTGEIETVLFNKIIDADSELNMKRFLNKFQDGKHKDKVAKKLYTKIADNGSREDITNFIKKFPNLISTKQVEEDLKNAKIRGFEVSIYTDDKREIFELYINQNAPKDKAYIALRKMIKNDLADKEYTQAVKKMKKFKPNFKDNKKYEQLYKILTEDELKVDALTIGSHVNTSSNAELSPIISADGNTLYFCRANIKKYNEDIFVSQKKNEIWQEPNAVKRFAKFNSHESPQALSSDGNTLILFKNGTLYNSEKETNGWSKPEALPTTINIGSWQADARITADNKAIIFSSGTSSYAEDIDIYISVKDKNGNWGEAFSLGNSINTSKADRAPFLHPDMKTLYFSSRGHVGLGQADIFISKRLDDTWTNWSEPINMGKSLNSTGVEFEFKVTTDGRKAYFSKENGHSNFDIFVADLPQAYQPEKVTTITGSVESIDGTPIGTEIVWEDLNTGKVIQTTSSDPVTGDFFATLPPQEGKIGYTIKHKGYIPLSGNIDVSKEDAKNIVLEEPMVIVSIEEMKTTGFKFELNNLFFETAKFDIKPTSYPELNRLSDWMKEYQLVIEILGHTDNVGEADANQLLSENRANAVREYLIKSGCTSTNISTKGFGEKEPVKSNDTVSGRARNRRVEIQLKG